ncbi:MAG TPA: DNA repair protein RecN [Methylomirabilota bacterium]|nr:DNA repair protein RecN [Methylomirabilota bacterium]
MLKELRIRNLAIIDAVTIPFSPGLNILTGETGAGKSIMIDALTLLLGERAQPTETIRTGAESATIEAVFTLPRKSPVPALLDAHGFALDEGQLVVRRELVRGGRGRAFLNDSNATLSVLEKLGEALVEVHGQHESQALLRPSRHLDLIDAFGGLGILREKLRQRYEEWQTVAAELADLTAAARDKASRLELYQTQIAEIEAARLQPGEEETLREERKRLQNAERLAEGATAAYTHLYDDPGAAAARLGQATAALRELAKVDPSLAATVQALDVSAVQLDEAVRALRSYRDTIVFDPPRLDEIERRLDEVGRLRRKYGDTVEVVLAARDQMAAELDKLTHGDEQSRQLGERLEKLRTELGTRAADLSARRGQAAAQLENLVTAELTELDIDKPVFKVRFSREPAGEGEIAVGPEGWRLQARGVDQAEFLFSPNPGEEPKPLARIVSGGELSRTMLALKVILAASDAVPVLIFDEVDAGIGGKTADIVGRKLRQVARTRQVLCITHLPQIACYADHHLLAEKRVEEDRTVTTVTVLGKEERVREVARMLGGESVTETSLQHAVELIGQARPR